MQLTSISFAYPDVPASERARLLVARPRTDGKRQGVFFLATCLRVEILWNGEPESAATVLGDLYGTTDVPQARVRTGLDAFRHVCRVAAGLESAQLGEEEILAQCRQAVETLVESSGHPSLVRVAETAIGIARSGRRFLNGRVTGSLARAAARMVADLPRVVVLGDGAMARAVAAELEPSKTVVFSRRPKPVAGIQSRPWEEVGGVLGECSAVVSTIPGPVPILDTLERPDAPLLLVDLGMPPALTPGVSPRHVYLDVDEVASRVQAEPEPTAERAVESGSARAWQRLIVADEAGSIIGSVMDRVDRTVEEEVRRFGPRLSTAAEPEQVLRQLAHTVARRILHPSVSLIGSTPLRPEELEVLARAFGVGDG